MLLLFTASLNFSDNILLCISQSKSGLRRTVWVCTLESHYNEKNAYYKTVVSHPHKKEKESTPRDNMSSYFWARHSRGLWHVEQGGGKAQASQCMRKLITRREEANAVYLGFLHSYNRQALWLPNYAALQMAWNDPGYFVPPGGRRWEVLWSVVVVGRVVFCQSGLASEPWGGLSKGALMTFKELQAMTGWVIFILLWFGERPKATCWRLTLSETGY